MVTFAFTEISAVMLGLFFLDYSRTFINLRKARNSQRRKDWWNYELNPIVNGLLKKYGLEKGMFFSLFILFPIWCLIWFTVPTSPAMGDIIFFWFGVYSVIITIHLTYVFGIREL